MNAPALLRRAARLQLVGGGLGLLAVAFVLLLVAASPDAGSHAPQMLAPPLLLVAFALALPAAVAGGAVLAGSAWGPLLLAIVATVQLPLLPFGTALGAYTLWALRRVGRDAPGGRREPPPLPSPRSPSPSSWPSSSPSPSPWPSPSPSPPLLSSLLPEPERTAPLLRVMVWVGFGFVAVIAAGFWISGDPVPAAATAIVGPVLAVLSRVLSVARRAQAQQAGEPR